MATTPARRPRVKPARHARYRPGILRLSIGKETTIYAANPLPADFGLGFTLTKQEAERGPDGLTIKDGATYHVNLDPNTGRHSCECLGHLHHGRCKHVSALLALFVAGRLQAAPARVSKEEADIYQPADRLAALAER